jgi:hypothetical protein
MTRMRVAVQQWDKTIMRYVIALGLPCDVLPLGPLDRVEIEYALNQDTPDVLCRAADRFVKADLSYLRWRLPEAERMN